MPGYFARVPQVTRVHLDGEINLHCLRSLLHLLTDARRLSVHNAALIQVLTSWRRLHEHLRHLFATS